MPNTSAGLLMFRRRGGSIEVLLVHPGGPFFRNKDDGAWSIPKGEIAGGEDALAAAKREFAEEIGAAPPQGNFIALTPVKQKSGKLVYAWAVEGDLDVSQIKSNTFTIEWPPRSGKQQAFPEVDRAGFFDPAAARKKINPAQAALIDELEKAIS